MLLKIASRYLIRSPFLAAFSAVGVALIACALIFSDHVKRSWGFRSDELSAQRLITRNRISIIQSIPLSYETRIQGVAGIKSLTYNSWLGGYFQTPTNKLSLYAVPDSSFFSVHREFRIPDDAMQSFRSERIGVLVGEGTARKLGLAVGDSLHVEGAVYPGPWQLRVSGIYPTDDAGMTQMFMHWSYFDSRNSETLPHIARNIDNFTIELSDAKTAGHMSKQIDELFENSTIQTLTESEEAFSAGFISMLESRLFVLNTLTVIGLMGAMLMLAATSAIATFTRRRELNALRLIGLSDWFVARLIVAEILIVSVVGGLLGVLFAWLLGEQFGGIPGFSDTVPFSLSADVLLRATGVASVVGVLAGLVGCASIIGKPPAELIGRA